MFDFGIGFGWVELAFLAFMVGFALWARLWLRRPGNELGVVGRTAGFDPSDADPTPPSWRLRVWSGAVVLGLAVASTVLGYPSAASPGGVARGLPATRAEALNFALNVVWCSVVIGFVLRVLASLALLGLRARNRYRRRGGVAPT